MKDRLVPEIEIQVDGQKLQTTLSSKLLSAKVNYCLEKSDMVQLTFSDDDMSLQNSDIFSHGKELIVKLGYNQKFTKMIESEIVRIDLDYETNSSTTITIIGFDKMFRLNREKHSRSFLKMKDSDIASKIASEMGLKADIDSTNQKHDYVFQNNQSNLAFLKQRARRIDYEVEVVDKTLIFKKARDQKREKTVRLVWDRNLISFHPRIDATNIVEEVEVTGWNIKTKELIKAKARAGEERKSIKGEEGSSKLKGKFDSKSQSFKVDSPISSLEEAKEMAKARLNQLNMEYITGYGVAIGEAKVVAGKLIEIDEVGKMVSGEYYITACEHIYNNRGYRTYFDFRRGVEAGEDKKQSYMNALNKEIVDINKKSDKREEKTWIEINIEAEDLENYDGRKYELELPDGTKRTGIVNKSSTFNIRADGIDKGTAKFRILDE